MRTLLFIIILLQSILAQDTIKVRYTDGYAPFSFQEEGQARGIIIDWWKLWSKESHIPIKFIPEKNLTNAVSDLSDDEVIAGLFVTNERAQNLLFGDYILAVNITLFSLDTPIESGNITQIKDSIGVVKGDYAIKLIQKNFPNLNLKTYDSYNELYDDAKAQNIRFFVKDIPESNKKIKYNDSTTEKFKYRFTLKQKKLRPAVRQDNDKLLTIIQKNADKITVNDLKEIGIQWGIVPHINNPILMIVVITVIIILIVLIVILIQKRRFSKVDVKKLIDNGENDKVEFKSSLRYDYRRQASNKELEMAIIKTISAFLNSYGGKLVIGVDDSGEILGLEKDYISFQKKNSDGFLLALSNKINITIGKGFHQYIKTTIVHIDGKEICLVDVKPSKKPVFIKHNKEELFFIRTSASSQPLGLKESYEYIQSHWR